MVKELLAAVTVSPVDGATQVAPDAPRHRPHGKGKLTAVTLASGEYVHDAPWSERSQGRSNVSHGCINLGPNDSKAFYDFSQDGDVIDVVGGTRPPVAGDHGVMDWTLDWSQWTPGVVTAA